MEAQERAAERKAACRALLEQVRSIEAEARGAFPGPALRDALLDFADRHRALLPDDDFELPRAHGRMHALSDGLDTPYGLYIHVARPGKEAEPHCHGLWSVGVGLAGREVNRFWRVTEQSSATRARVEETHSITLAPGTGMVMSEHDLHSTFVLEGGEARILNLFARPFEQFPRVVFYHPKWGTRRALPQASGRTLRGD